jgi:antitoxin component YwqK of YwqJK toxin-antitoxin module
MDIIEHTDPTTNITFLVKNCDSPSFKLSFVKVFYPNGILGLEFTLFDDLLCGDWKSYYPDGTLNISKYYEENALHGSYKYYYPNGELKIKANYRAMWLNGVYGGYLDGTYYEWNQAGHLIKKIEYSQGQQKPI